MADIGGMSAGSSPDAVAAPDAIQAAAMSRAAIGDGEREIGMDLVSMKSDGRIQKAGRSDGGREGPEDCIRMPVPVGGFNRGIGPKSGGRSGMRGSMRQKRLTSPGVVRHS